MNATIKMKMHGKNKTKKTYILKWWFLTVEIMKRDKTTNNSK